MTPASTPKRWAKLFEIDGYQVVYRLVPTTKDFPDGADEESGGTSTEEGYQLFQELACEGGTIGVHFWYHDESDALEALAKVDEAMARKFVAYCTESMFPFFAHVEEDTP